MAQASPANSADKERAELEIVLDALARNPRLANLLRYLADRYLQGKSAEITEYNIATEVFGRSRTSFDGSTDSIARVEAHRLRKWLKDYYEKQGRDHPIHISVPHRSYIPEFIRRTDIPEAEASSGSRALDTGEHEDLALEAIPSTQPPQETAEADTAYTITVVQPSFRKRTLLYSAVAIAALILLIFGAVRFISRKNSANSSSIGSPSQPNANQSPMPANPVHVPLRLLAGYEGTPRVDSAGDYWEADRYFKGGAAFLRPNVPVTRTSDQMLFQHWRTGDVTYDFPLAPGPYEVHLFFVAPESETANLQTFHIFINYRLVVQGFNISSDALGTNVADERVFRDVYPDIDGHLRLGFSSERSSATVNAIEILPGLPHRQLPVRLVMQREAITDHDGNLWHPDTYFLGGTPSDFPKQVGGTPDPNLYAQERYGHFTYAIPVDTHGRYTLVLHFAELYWGSQTSGLGGVGSRVFRVICNGSTLLDNFNIFKEAGSLNALTKTFHHLQPSAEGKLDLTFEPIVNFATVSAIEVIDESE